MPALAAVGVVWATKSKWYWVVLVTMLLSCFLVGSRTIVMSSGVLFVYGAFWVGIRLGWKRVVATLVLTLLAAGAVSVLRIGVGRENIVHARGVGERALLIVDAISSRTGTPDPIGLNNPEMKDEPEPVGQRIDGNSIPSAILMSQFNGVAPLDWNMARYELLLGIPSIVYPKKLLLPVQERGAKDIFRSQFGLTSPPFPADFLVSQLGSLLAYFGIPGVILGFFVIGASYGCVDLMISRRRSWITLFVGLGALVCALSYEQTLYIYATVGRTVLFLVGVFYLARLFDRRRLFGPTRG